MDGILRKLLDVKSLNDQKIEDIIKELEKRGCKWRDYGDLSANYGRIHITSSPNSIFPERITNAIDGTIEKYAESDPKIKSSMSPRGAVQKLFGISGGYLSKVPEVKRSSLVEKIGINILVSDENENVNVSFRDCGIGLSREEMPETILSLNRENKMRKWYVMGQYGQGGGTTCTHSEYVVIVSKKINSQTTNFTIVRYNDLKDDPYVKDGKWEYLVSTDNLPPFTSDIKFDNGTQVIHVNLKTSLGKAFINYYSLIDQFLFDPPMPFLLEYLGEKSKGKRTLFGARRRLESDKDTLHDEFIVPLNNEEGDEEKNGHVIIRYFLLPSGKDVSSVFSRERDAIIITYNGQVQGTLERSMIKEKCKLSYLYKSLIIQIDCDNLTNWGRRYVFTATRDKITEKAEDFFTKMVSTEIGKNERLKWENQKREEELLSEKSIDDDLEMKKRLVEMLNRVSPGTFKFLSKIYTEKEGEEEGTFSRGGGESKTLEPLPTKSEPTFLKIVNKAAPIRIPTNSSCVLRLESDAPNNIFEKGWELKINNNDFKIISQKEFTGGRSKCRLELSKPIKPGKEYEIHLTLSFKDKIIKSDTRLVVVVPPKEDAKKGKVLEVNAPRIVEIYKEDVYYIQNNWNENVVGDIQEREDSVTIYINMENKWLQGTLRKLNYTPGRIIKLKKDYALHIAYHIFIQNEEMRDKNIEDKDQIKFEEMNRVSRTVLVALTSERAVES